MAIINQKTGYFGFTVNGNDGSSIDSNGQVDRVIFAIQYPCANKDVEFTISNRLNDWGAMMGDGSIIPIYNPVVLFSNRDNAIVQFEMGERYPSNSPCFLVYRSTSASFNVIELNENKPFVPNTLDGHFGFTIGTETMTTRAIISIPFMPQSFDVSVAISNGEEDWALYMGDGRMIKIINPQILFVNKDNVVVQFLMTEEYPSNSPCLLIYKSEEAFISFMPSDRKEFIPINDIDGIPDNAIAGDEIDLLSINVTPINASIQTIVWEVVSGNATINKNRLKFNDIGDVNIKATVTNGGEEHSEFTKTFDILVEAPEILIKKQPIPNIYASFGNIDHSIYVDAICPAGILAYQWYVNTTNTNSGGAPINGATSEHFDIPHSLEGNRHYYYYCEISNNISSQKVASDVTDVFVAIRVTGVAINNKPTESLSVFNMYKLNASVIPSTATNKSLVWESSNTAIATVDQYGNVLCNDTGEVIITVKSVDGGYSDYCRFNLTDFVPVENIEGIIEKFMVNTPTVMSAKVIPTNASFKSITWEAINTFDGEVNISGNTITILTPPSTGFITLRASIANGLDKNVSYIQDFNVNVCADFVPVQDIILDNTSTNVDNEITLSASVIPNGATNNNIVWAVVDANGTGCTIVENKLIATDVGTAKIMATVINGSDVGKDYTKFFNIEIKPSFVPVEDIKCVTTQISLNTRYKLEYEVIPSNATHKDAIWKLVNATEGVTLEKDGTIYIQKPIDRFVVSATILCGTEDGIPGDTGVNFTKMITLKAADFVPVTDIINIPEKIGVGESIDLSPATIVPNTATYQHIVWDVEDPGDTGVIITDKTATFSSIGNARIRASIQKGASLDEDFVKIFDIRVFDFTTVESIENIPTQLVVNTIPAYDYKAYISPGSIYDLPTDVDGVNYDTIALANNWVKLPSTAVMRPDGTIFNNNGSLPHSEIILNQKYAESIFRIYHGYIMLPTSFVRCNNGYVEIPDGTYLSPDGNLHVFIGDQEVYEITIYGLVYDKRDITSTKIIFPRDSIMTYDGEIVLPNGFVYNKDGSISMPEDALMDGDDVVLVNGIRIHPDGTTETDGHWEDQYSIANNRDAWEYRTMSTYKDKVLLVDGTVITHYDSEYGPITIQRPNGIRMTAIINTSRTTNYGSFPFGNVVLANNRTISALNTSILNIGFVNMTIDTKYSYADICNRLPDGSYLEGGMVHLPNGSTDFRFVDRNNQLITVHGDDLDLDEYTYIVELNGLTYGTKLGVGINPDGSNIPTNAMIKIVTNGEFNPDIQVLPVEAKNKEIRFVGPANSIIGRNVEVYDCARFVEVDYNESTLYAYFIAGTDACTSTFTAVVKNGLGEDGPDYEQTVIVSCVK